MKISYIENCSNTTHLLDPLFGIIYSCHVKPKGSILVVLIFLSLLISACQKVPLLIVEDPVWNLELSIHGFQIEEWAEKNGVQLVSVLVPTGEEVNIEKINENLTEVSFSDFHGVLLSPYLKIDLGLEENTQTNVFSFSDPDAVQAITEAVNSARSKSGSSGKVFFIVPPASGELEHKIRSNFDGAEQELSVITVSSTDYENFDPAVYGVAKSSIGDSRTIINMVTPIHETFQPIINEEKDFYVVTSRKIDNAETFVSGGLLKDYTKAFDGIGEIIKNKAVKDDWKFSYIYQQFHR